MKKLYSCMLVLLFVVTPALSVAQSSESIEADRQVMIQLLIQIIIQEYPEIAPVLNVIFKDNPEYQISLGNSQDTSESANNNTSPDLFVGPAIPQVGTYINDMYDGDSDAQVAVVTYTDPECDFCERNQTTVLDVVQEDFSDSQVVFVSRLLVDDLTTDLAEKSIYLSCVGTRTGDTNYYDYLDLLFDNQTMTTSAARGLALDYGLSESDLDACFETEASVLSLIYSDAFNIGVTAVPSFYLIDQSTGDVYLSSAHAETLSRDITTILDL